MIFQTMQLPILSQNSEICTFDFLLDEFSLLYLYCLSGVFYFIQDNISVVVVSVMFSLFII